MDVAVIMGVLGVSWSVVYAVCFGILRNFGGC